MSSGTLELLDTRPCVGEGMYALDNRPDSRTTVISTAGTHVVSGWAFASKEDPVPPEVALEVHSEKTGEVFNVAASRTDRLDVANHFACPVLINSGFYARIPLNYTMNGTYHVTLVQKTASVCYRAERVLELRVALQDYELTARQGLAAKFLSGAGLEIGALQRRLPVPASCSVTYVDRMSYEDLIQHYPELAGMPIQHPDVIDDGERLELFADVSQDFLIANHFLEHCQNPIGTLRNLLRVVKPGSFLFMAVPDRRFTFDIQRQSTPYSVLQETYLSGTRSNIVSLYREWVTDVLRLTGEPAEAFAQDLLKRGYSIHYNVWDLQELMAFILSAKDEFRLPFDLVAAVSTDNEVITILQRR